LQNSKKSEVGGIGRKQSGGAISVKNSGKVGIKDAFPAQAVAAHPFEGLVEAGIARLNQANGRVGKEIFQLLHGLVHRKRRGKPALVGNDMKKFRGNQGRENQFFTSLGFGLDCCDGF
jgi:hypothetical protein